VVVKVVVNSKLTSSFMQLWRARYAVRRFKVRNPTAMPISCDYLHVNTWVYLSRWKVIMTILTTGREIWSPFSTGELMETNKVKMCLCLTNLALRLEGVWGSGCIAPHFLHLGTSCRWVVRFTLQPLYTRERAPGTHSILDGVYPRAGLDDGKRRVPL
jgi:hypothetical protein